MDTGGVDSMGAAGDAVTALRAAMVAVAGAAREFDPSVLALEDVVVLAREFGRTARVLDTLYARAAGEVAARGAPQRAADATPVDHLARTTGVEASVARRALDAVKAIAAQPALHQAALRGDVSLAQATKIAPVSGLAPESTGRLIAAAQEGWTALNDAIAAVRAEAESSSERRTRHRRDRSLHLWTDADGMACGRFRLPPEEGGQVRVVLDKLTDRVFRADTSLTHEQAAADALVALATSGQGAAVDVQMAVVVDLEVLRRGDARSGERCEIPGVGPVNAAWAREQFGDAFVNLVVAHGRDVRCVARPGHRYMTPHLRMALLVAGRECAVDGCGRRGYLERDHHVGIAEQGPSSFDNVNWLCSHHHRKKTAGWTLGPPEPATGKRMLTPPPEPHPRK